MAFSTFSMISSNYTMVINYIPLPPLPTLDSNFTMTQVATSSLGQILYAGCIDTDSKFYSIGYTDGSSNFLKTSTDNGINWTSLGNTTFVNRAGIIAHKNVIYIGSNGGGIRRSTNTGVNWSSTFALSISIGAKNMIISKTTQERFFSSTNGQSFILQTPYSATNVKQVTSSTVSNVPANSIACCGTDDLSTVYVGSTGGVNKVIITWGADNTNTSFTCSTIVSIVSGQQVRGLACSSNGTIVYACGQTGQIYKSINSGISFSVLSNSTNVTDTNTWRSMACSANGVVVVACRNIGVIYLSIDGGITWTNDTNSKAWNSVDISRDGTKLIAGELFYWTGTVTGTVT